MAPATQITKAKYEAMLVSYRLNPAKHTEAARAAHVTAVTSAKAWNVGWPALGWLPIRRVLELEQVEARANRHEENAAAALEAAKTTAAQMVAEAQAAAALKLLAADQQVVAKLEAAVQGAKAEVARVLDSAKLDAVETTRQEARISQSVRQAALSVQGLAALIFQPDTIRAIGAAISAGLAGKKTLTMGDAKRMTDFLDKVADIGLKAIVLERKRVGAPEMVLQMRSEGDMSIAEAEAKSQSIVRAVERAKRKAMVLAGEIVENDDGEGNGVH